jgi:hypothetical protein
MTGKKYNKDIFQKYEQVLLEQATQNPELSNLLKEISGSQLQQRTKDILTNLLNNPNVAQIFATTVQQRPKTQKELDDEKFQKDLPSLMRAGMFM